MNINIYRKSDYKQKNKLRLICFFEKKIYYKDVLTDEENKMVELLFKNSDFGGKYGEVEEISYFENEEHRKIILVGLGNSSDIEPREVENTLANVIRKLNPDQVEIEIYDELTKFISPIVEGIVFGRYFFEKYKTNKKENKLNEIILISSSSNYDEISIKANEAFIKAEATCFARDLVNEPANIMTPKFLAEKAIKIGGDCDIDVAVYGREYIAEKKMEAFLAVSKGAESEPKLIVMRYKGNLDMPEEITGFIGKGITYDSGGYQLKPGDRLIQMKHDMAGSASVIGAIYAIAKMKLKVNITVVVAACENLISGRSYKPGDIISSMAGKSIFIKSTDAEGRLSMADAITYAIKEEQITNLVDIASLTGVARMTFGGIASAVMGSDDNLYKHLENASISSSEKIWRLPMFKEYRKFINHDIADLANSGSKGAGAIVAGFFLKEFTEDLPWVHVDIAGSCWSDSISGIYIQGGTGYGTRLLYEFAKSLSK